MLTKLVGWLVVLISLMKCVNSTGHHPHPGESSALIPEQEKPLPESCEEKEQEYDFNNL
jgi:hypothetical protein